MIGGESTYVPPRKPTPRRTTFGSVGVTLTAASGSAGSLGFVTTPSGPSSQVAMTSGPPSTFLRAIVCGVRLGATLGVEGLETESRRGARPRPAPA